MTIPLFGDRVQETFTTTGTGTISLGGAVVGYQAFSSVLSNGVTAYYAATDGTNWEVGLGTYTSSGNTLARTTILSSSNSNAAVSWSSGTKNIWLDQPAAAIVPAQYNAIAGYLPSSITGTSTTASMTISPGQATDSTNVRTIFSPGSISWAASNGNAINGTDASSSTLANSTTYHMYICTGSSGTGVFCSATYPGSGVTFPTGYATYYRRIFSFVTNSSGAPIPYTAIETEGGALLAWLTTQINDVNVSNLSTTRVAYTLSVPGGIKVEPKIRAYSNSSASILFTSGDETDIAPFTGTTLPCYDVNNDVATVAAPYLTTNTSAQIGARSTAGSTVLFIVTRGFKDFRRA